MKRTAWIAAYFVALALGPAARADECTITVGLVMELTGPAGEYGQAGAKSVEMAFRDLNDAGGPHGCKLVADTRDSQSQGIARSRCGQSARSAEKSSCHHRRNHLVGVHSDPDVGHRPGQDRAGVAGLVVPDADDPRPRGQDQRHVLPHYHIGRAAGDGGREIRPRPGLQARSPSSTSTTISASTCSASSPRPTRRSAAKSSR